MCQLAQNKVNFSKQIVETNYYGYLFGEDDVIDSTSLWEEKYNSAKKRKRSKINYFAFHFIKLI